MPLLFRGIQAEHIQAEHHQEVTSKGLIEGHLSKINNAIVVARPTRSQKVQAPFALLKLAVEGQENPLQ